MMIKEHAAPTGFAFVPLHNPGDNQSTMGTSQEQAFGTEDFQKNQALSRKYTAIDGDFKNKIVTTVEPVFLFPLVDHLIGFSKMSALTMLHNIFLSYRKIYQIDLEENSAKMMGPYEPTEPLSRLIQHLERGRHFERAGGQKISDAMMLSKGITVLAHTAMFNEDFREWIGQTTN